MSRFRCGAALLLACLLGSASESGDQMNTAARYLAVTLTLTIVLAIPVMAQKKPYGNKEREDIHIYVFAAPNSNGSTDADSQDRAASVADLKKVLSRAHFTVVGSQSDASVSIEVEQGYMPAGTLTRSRRTGAFSSRMSPDDVSAVRLTVVAGDYSTTIVGSSLSGPVICHCHPYGTWAEAAVTAESQLDTWVQSNYDHLIALRNPGK
jgi:hypothetical protein